MWWVGSDADVAQAVNTCAFASFVATGQTCVTGARLLVHESLLEEVRLAMGRVQGAACLARLATAGGKRGLSMNHVSISTRPGGFLSVRWLSRFRLSVLRCVCVWCDGSNI